MRLNSDVLLKISTPDLPVYKMSLSSGILTSLNSGSNCTPRRAAKRKKSGSRILAVASALIGVDFAASTSIVCFSPGESFGDCDSVDVILSCGNLKRIYIYILTRENSSEGVKRRTRSPKKYLRHQMISNWGPMNQVEFTALDRGQI